MRKRLVTMITVTVMAVFCLTGCSGPFNADAVVKTARERGIKAATLPEFERFQNGGTFSGSLSDRSDHYYYIAKNGEEANSVYSKYFRLDEDNNLNVDGLACCNDQPDSVLYLHAVDDETAKKIYDEWVRSNKDDFDRSFSGSKSGYVYTVFRRYEETDPADEYALGIYRKGKAVMIVGEVNENGAGTNKKDSFFEKLGLVKPVNAIK